MVTMTRVFTTVCCLLAVTFLASCAAKQAENRWIQANSNLGGAEELLTIANRSGVLDDETFVATEPYALAARDTLASAKKHLDEGDIERFDALMEGFKNTLKRLREFYYETIDQEPVQLE